MGQATLDKEAAWPYRTTSRYRLETSSTCWKTAWGGVVLYDNPTLAQSSDNITIDIGYTPSQFSSLEIVTFTEKRFTSTRVRMKPGMTDFEYFNTSGTWGLVGVSGTTLTFYNDFGIGVAQVIGYR